MRKYLILSLWLLQSACSYTSVSDSNYTPLEEGQISHLTHSVKILGETAQALRGKSIAPQALQPLWLTESEKSSEEVDELKQLLNDSQCHITPQELPPLQGENDLAFPQYELSVDGEGCPLKMEVSMKGHAQGGTLQSVFTISVQILDEALRRKMDLTEFFLGGKVGIILTLNPDGSQLTLAGTQDLQGEGQSLTLGGFQTQVTSHSNAQVQTNSSHPEFFSTSEILQTFLVGKTRLSLKKTSEVTSTRKTEEFYINERAVTEEEYNQHSFTVDDLLRTLQGNINKPSPLPINAQSLCTISAFDSHEVPLRSLEKHIAHGGELPLPLFHLKNCNTSTISHFSLKNEDAAFVKFIFDDGIYISLRTTTSSKSNSFSMTKDKQEVRADEINGYSFLISCKPVKQCI